MLSCSTTQPTQSVNSKVLPPNTPGKCYALCYIQDQYTIKVDSFPIYSNIENVSYKAENIKIQSAHTEWVKKKADRNCLSADPEDCFLWCLVENPAHYRTIKIPNDPRQAGEVSYEYIETKTSIRKGGFTEWREVVCGDNISADLVRRVQNALLKNGYNVGKDGANNVLGAETKTALVKYQRDNGLPVGQLDFETLKSLGVRD